MARKASMWAKAAGEYYRKNKGKNGIESFSDVLKSSDFKSEYYAKYGKQGKTMGRKGKGMRSTKRYRGGEGETPPAPLPPEDLPSGGGAAASPSMDPLPSVTTSSISAAPLPPVNPQVVTGGKRKGKGKSRKMKGGDFGNFNAEEFIEKNSVYLNQLGSNQQTVENIIRLAKDKYGLNAGLNLPGIKDTNLEKLKEELERELDKKDGGKKKKAKKYSYKRFM